MKKIPFITLVLVSIIFSNCKNKNTAQEGAAQVATNAAKDVAAVAHAGKVVYVNIDSLQEKYTWFKQKNEALTQRQRSAESAFESKTRDFQGAVAAFQQKAQSGTVPPAQLQQEEKSLGTRQQSLASERDRKAKELSDEATTFNDELRKRIKTVLTDVQKQKGYDYVISYSDSAGSQFWYANPTLDITTEVLAILNAQK